MGTCLLNQTLSSLMYGPSSRADIMAPRISLVTSLVGWAKIALHDKVILKGFLPVSQGDTFKGIFI